MLVVASTEAVTVFHRRVLARLYSKCSAHDVPGEALCAPTSIVRRTRDLASEGEVQCGGHSPANLASEPHPRAVSLGLSLPPVRLPQTLEQAVKRVLADYPIKSLKHDSKLLVGHLLGRTPPSSELLERRKRKRQTRAAAGGKEEFCEEGEQEFSEKEEEGSWRGEDVQMTAKRKPKYSPVRYNKREAITYIACRLHATYAATYSVLNEIALRCPDFRPETLLDFGSGVGTTVWAAHELWSGSIYEYQCIDVSDEAEKVARLLRQRGDEGGESCIPGVYFKQYLPVTNQVPYDLVVSAYSLSEIPTIALRKSVVRSLWEKTNDFLVLVEIGNRPGFSIITEAREMLLEGYPSHRDPAAGDSGGEGRGSEGHLFAPCPHDSPCPLVVKDRICYFGQRSQLSPVQKHTPQKHVGFHIEKFSYAVLRKGARQQIEGCSRVLQPVKKRSRHVICSLCSPDGSAHEQIFTKGKSGPLYRVARSCKWRDLLEAPSASETPTEQDGEP